MVSGMSFEVGEVDAFSIWPGEAEPGGDGLVGGSRPAMWQAPLDCVRHTSSGMLGIGDAAGSE